MSIREVFIPKGYEIHISSWENDGDDYSTQVISGLSKEDVKFYIETIKLFSAYIGNIYNTLSNSEYGWNQKNSILDVFDKHPKSKAAMQWKSKFYGSEEEGASSDESYHFITHILGRPVQYNYGFCRVYESHKVYYLKDDVSYVYDEIPDDQF